MIKKLFLISSAVLAVAGLPQYAQTLTGFFLEETPDAAPRTPVAAGPKIEAQPVANYATGQRAVSIPMNKAGHFSADFRINGRNLRGLIDTGATYVAINASTARGLGLGLAARDYKHEVRTANGAVKAALVMLDRVDVGSISVNKVEAFVLEDAALSSTLIGMSFMSKIGSYRVKGSTLELID